MNQRERGITLIALIITIIILIILTAITIGNVMNSDLFGLAKKAVTDTSMEGEREFLSTKTVLSYLGEDKVGEKLADRKAFGEGSWHIVSVLDTKESYGTDWYYLESGTEVEGYGKLKYNWVVNYRTGEVIYLGESSNYASITDASGVAVTGGLIFNADATLTDEVLAELEKGGKEITTEYVEKKLGTGVKLHGFDNLETAFEGGSFNFDGVNDYITVPYEKDNPDKKIDKGLTYEFYGKINKRGTSYDEFGTKNPAPYDQNEYSGLFCLWNGNEDLQATLRFGFFKNANQPSNPRILYNVSISSTVTSAFSDKNNPHQQYIYLNDYNREIDYGDEFYLTVTLDGENNIQAVYINGEILKNGDKESKGELNRDYWNNFIINELPSLTTFCLGRSSMERDGWWHYSNTSIYALRLYNKALTEEEVVKNYTAAVAYRNSMLSK